jgi:death-on-curing protein
MSEPQWIHYECATLIQKRLAAEHGGKVGLKDPNILRQAIEAPKNLYHKSATKPSLSQLAACYAYYIAKQEPFFEGNRRVSLILSELFLRLNNSSFAASQLEKYNLIKKL